VLRHRAAAATCACLNVEAVAEAVLHAEGTAHIRPAVVLHNQCPNSSGFTKKSFFLTWFSTIVDYHSLAENYFSYHVYYYSFLQRMRRLRLVKEGTHNFLRCPSLNCGALAVLKHSGAATVHLMGSVLRKLQT